MQMYYNVAKKKLVRHFSKLLNIIFFVTRYTYKTKELVCCKMYRNYFENIFTSINTRETCEKSGFEFRQDAKEHNL